YRTMADFAAALAEYLQTSTQLSGNYAGVTATSSKRDLPDTYPEISAYEGEPKKKGRIVAAIAVFAVLAAVGVGAAIVIKNLSDRKNGDGTAPTTPTPSKEFAVVIDSDPRGADIYLKGVKQDKRTKTTFKLTEGTYVVKLVLDGYTTWQKSITV